MNRHTRFPGIEAVGKKFFHAERFERDALIVRALNKGIMQATIADLIGCDKGTVRNARRNQEAGMLAYRGGNGESRDEKLTRAVKLLRDMLASPEDHRPPTPREPAYPEWADPAMRASLKALFDFRGVLPREGESTFDTFGSRASLRSDASLDGEARS